MVVLTQNREVVDDLDSESPTWANRTRAYCARYLAWTDSGWGDGVYPISVGYDAEGERVGVRVVFLRDDEAAQ